MNRILVIEDDVKMCKELSEIFRDEGYWVDSISNGIEGSNAIAEGGYDLVLLDLKLPGMTGFEILNKTRESMPDLKIIVLTGRPLEKEAENGFASVNDEEEKILKKANYVINKPFNIEDILKKIKDLLPE